LPKEDSQNHLRWPKKDSQNQLRWPKEDSQNQLRWPKEDSQNQLRWPKEDSQNQQTFKILISYKLLAYCSSNELINYDKALKYSRP
jgi:hypothetical protein